MYLPLRDLDPHVIHGCLGARESAFERHLNQSSRSAGCTVVTITQTMHVTPPVTIGRIYAVNATRPAGPARLMVIFISLTSEKKKI